MNQVTEKRLHVLVHGSNVHSRECLTNMIHGRTVWDRIVYDLQCSVVARTGHSNGNGYSYTYLLSDGHMTVHTYPERNAFFVDLLYEHPNNSEAIEFITSPFDGAHFSYQIIRY